MTEDNIRQKQKAMKKKQNKKELLESKNMTVERKSIQQEGQENLLKQREKGKWKIWGKKLKRQTEGVNLSGPPPN